MVAVWSIISCSTPATSSEVSSTATALAQASSASAPARGAIKELQACFGALPAQSRAAFDAHSFTTTGGLDFGPLAVTKGLVIGQLNTNPKSLAEIDLASGRMTRIASLDPKAAGTGWLSADLPWVVWQQGDSKYNIGDWSVHARNQTSGVETVLATSRLGNGSFVYGQVPQPVVRHGVAFWAQPLPRMSQQPQAELRMVDLATGHASVLHSGTISSPVFAGSYLVWAKSDSDGKNFFQAVEADTQKPVALPEGLRSLGSTIGYLGGSQDYLAWSQAGGGSNDLMVWKVDTEQYYHATLDVNHPVQFMQLAGHFMVWFAATRSSVLDLTTGYGFDIKGSLAASPEAIVESSGSRLSWIPTASAPAIGGCHS